MADLLKMISLSLLFFLTSSTIFTSSIAQDSPQDFVDAHNAARAQVGVGPVSWDETVANYAQQYANQHINDCQMVHSNGPYGENLAWSSADLSGTNAVQMWVNEKQFYDYASNSCVGSECRHYTQVVWKNSVKIGCAKVECNNNGGTFITCNYDPSGNYVNQRPY
ncbi:hypothetical protein IC582_000162 [Cucumis melo]|uniref:Basic form of pathogenesis-related protein 1 n=2 Tax=Cucumis melo TaxID=3656 RepID=A0A1S3BZL6_CUCME|nr:basic form of pathogenesis-related protein 1 [Cucumis melo]KAA0031385.1 basic form of pathogenesis-related protein 1 [Cucumis melo var. makuwa]TYK06837.1 basic form of pathogenesis-related protein 1 [Cucumis melo var. makuwa]